jgi:serine/threonine protein kinase
MDDVRREADHSAGREPKVPGYQVCRWLGSGASAEVWLVTEEATGRKLALKCFGAASGNHASETAEEDARREILIMSVLDHEHLVKAHAVVRFGEAAEHSLGIVMDYAPGGSLGQLVAARGRLSVGETVTVLTPIAQVLGYLHGKGFTHSDVSPGNVLFSGHGKPLLADLGVARMVGDPVGVPGLGTAGFRDPSPVDAVRAGLQPGRDVYAAAALGWYCLTGAPPRPAADRPPLSLLVPDVPRELAAALEAGLSDDRRQRPGAAELATAIYRSAGAVPVDLSLSVHPTVLPELLTRRPEPPSGGRRRERIRAWGRRLSTSPPVRALRQRRSRAPEAARRHVSDGAHGAPALRPSRSGGRNTPTPHDPQANEAAFHGQALPGRTLRDQPRLHSRRAATAAAPRRRRTAAWTGLFTVPVVAGAWLLLGAPGMPLSNELPGSAATLPSLVRDGFPEPGSVPGPTPRRPQPATVPDSAMVPDAVRNQLRAENPAEAVKGLAWLRSKALSEGRLELLGEVNAGNSPAAAADRRISARLQDSGNVLAGFTTSLTGVRSLPESTGTRAVVAVTAATSGYEERSAAGAVVATGAPQPRRGLRLVLVRVNGQWLISDILPAA